MGDVLAALGQKAPVYDAGNPPVGIHQGTAYHQVPAVRHYHGFSHGSACGFQNMGYQAGGNVDGIVEIVACVGAEQDASLLINDADDPVAETVLDFLGDNILFDVGCHNAVDHTRSLIHHRLSHCDEVIADRAADNEAALMGRKPGSFPAARNGLIPCSLPLVL